jgi:transposase
MPAQYVKPYVQTNKSDYLDAEAIAEAAQRPRMRFVPIKTVEQLDLQALHRVRERWVMRRTAVVNQIRSLLLERGLTLPKGRSHLDEQLPGILEDAELNLSGSIRALLGQLKLELEQLAARIEEMDRVTQKTARENEDCQRRTEIPGVGPVTATALIAAVGNGSAIGKGRKLSAWMGIVPGEYSTGGKQKLLGISKRGNKYLRRLFVQEARSVLVPMGRCNICRKSSFTRLRGRFRSLASIQTKRSPVKVLIDCCLTNRFSKESSVRSSGYGGLHRPIEPATLLGKGNGQIPSLPWSRCNIRVSVQSPL